MSVVAVQSKRKHVCACLIVPYSFLISDRAFSFSHFTILLIYSTPSERCSSKYRAFRSENKSGWQRETYRLGDLSQRAMRDAAQIVAIAAREGAAAEKVKRKKKR